MSRSVQTSLPADAIACPECDLLLLPCELAAQHKAACPRCHAELYQFHDQSLERTLAATLTALVLLILANAFPIMTLRIGSLSVACSLPGTALALFEQGMVFLPVLVLFTTLIVPALQLAALLYLLVPLLFDRLPRYAVPVMRWLQRLRPWSMVEVFMLGILVSLTKLVSMAEILPGIAIWSVALLMLAMTYLFSVFDARQIWQRIDEAEHP